MRARKRSGALIARGDNVPVTARWGALDAVRGLAILAMMLDHVVFVVGGPELLRLTVGRCAMPAFFILAGYLSQGREPGWRHARIGLLGLAIPVMVPWIDNPNVLVLWAVGCCLLWVSVTLGIPRWLIVAVGLTVGANHWQSVEQAYEPALMFGLMALGTMVPAASFTWADKCPGWVQAVGRHPIAWYVGHLAVIQIVITAVLWH